jgi:uncharacterized protein YdeI (YjbR/CyaY-like superfamily)
MTAMPTTLPRQATAADTHDTAGATGQAEPLYFASPAEFGHWLATHGASARALLVGFHKVGSGRGAMSWPQSVDEALCVGWIDGVRKRVDAARYTIRFTPRRPCSHWSAVNVARMAELQLQGRVQAAGLAAFAQRSEARTARAAHEQTAMPELGAALEAQFRADASAWAWFNRQPPGYRKRVLWRVVQAKQPATAARRLAQLIDASAQQRRI